MAATPVSHTSVLIGFGVSAIAALPLFVFNVLLHRLIQSISPDSGSVGIRQLILSILVFTAIETVISALLKACRLSRDQAAEMLEQVG